MEGKVFHTKGLSWQSILLHLSYLFEKSPHVLFISAFLLQSSWWSAIGHFPFKTSLWLFTFCTTGQNCRLSHRSITTCINFCYSSVRSMGNIITTTQAIVFTNCLHNYHSSTHSIVNIIPHRPLWFQKPHIRAYVGIVWNGATSRLSSAPKKRQVMVATLRKWQSQYEGITSRCHGYSVILIMRVMAW